VNRCETRECRSTFATIARTSSSPSMNAVTRRGLLHTSARTCAMLTRSANTTSETPPSLPHMHTHARVQHLLASSTRVEAALLMLASHDQVPAPRSHRASGKGRRASGWRRVNWFRFAIYSMSCSLTCSGALLGWDELLREPPSGGGYNLSARSVA